MKVVPGPRLASARYFIQKGRLPKIHIVARDVLHGGAVPRFREAKHLRRALTGQICCRLQPAILGRVPMDGCTSIDRHLKPGWGKFDADLGASGIDNGDVRCHATIRGRTERTSLGSPRPDSATNSRHLSSNSSVNGVPPFFASLQASKRVISGGFNPRHGHLTDVCWKSKTTTSRVRKKVNHAHY